ETQFTLLKIFIRRQESANSLHLPPQRGILNTHKSECKLVDGFCSYLY
ncbi:16524_t:CDS:1, partial [Funneliformis geosporum]